MTLSNYQKRQNAEAPNHALQRTGAAVTARASAAAFPPAMHGPRQPRPSLSLGSLGPFTHPMLQKLTVIILAIWIAGCSEKNSSSAPEIQDLSVRIATLEGSLAEAQSAEKTSRAETSQLRTRVSDLSNQNATLTHRLQDFEETDRKVKQQAEAALQSQGIIEVQVLKVYEFADSARIDFSITNRSSHFWDYWAIGADAHNSAGTYLGHGMTNGKNVRPGQSLTATLSFGDVRLSAFATWKPMIEQIVIGSAGGGIKVGTEKFTLKELK